MRSIARRTAVGAALLLVMPVAVWISGWRWQPGEQSWLLKAAFWVTETVHPALGRHYTFDFIRLVSLVSAFSH
ncbi:phosphatidylglycerophosphatase B [Escherichia coli]|nr:phosphatidylglycerophosphatase B [Escherichia coli]